MSLLNETNKEKYLYCVMDSTNSEFCPGWDVEVFKDTAKSRKAWTGSDVGTDDSTLREYSVDSLTVLGINSFHQAEVYVDELKKEYQMSDITKIEQTLK